KFPADRWDADAIAVMCDSGNHTGEEPAIGGDIWTAIGDRPEPERVQAKLRPSAHGENVANDPANPGRRALERFDRAGVIVTFHFERDGPAVADIDHVGVFVTGLNQNVGPARWKFLQFAPRILVGAMLIPHLRIDLQLGEVLVASELSCDPL